MGITIQLAKKHRKRPSEFMGITDAYLAYIFDEAAAYLEAAATDKEGNTRWNRIKWRDKKGSSNADLIKFAQTGK